jgi:hypothetical protein
LIGEVKLRRKREIVIFIVGLSILFLSFSKPIYAFSTPEVYGQNFYLNFHLNESIIFQGDNFNVNLTVDNGSLTGQVKTLLMYDVSGKMELTTNQTCNINMTSNNPNVRITYNHLLISGHYEEIKWSLLSSYNFIDFTFLLGIFGILGMFISAGYGVYLAKEEEYSKALMTIVMFILCFAFFYSWLSVAGA